MFTIFNQLLYPASRFSELKCHRVFARFSFCRRVLSTILVAAPHHSPSGSNARRADSVPVSGRSLDESSLPFLAVPSAHAAEAWSGLGPIWFRVSLEWLGPFPHGLHCGRACRRHLPSAGA